MLYSRPYLRICQNCSSHLFHLFRHGFCSAPKETRLLRLDRQLRAQLARRTQARHLTVKSALRQSDGSYQVSVQNGPITKSPVYMEAIVRQTRETFGDTLPNDFLSPEENVIYERLYGPPIQTTRPEDVRSLQELSDAAVEDEEEQERPRDALLKENVDGEWEEIMYQVAKRQEEKNADLGRDPVEETLEEVEELDEMPEYSQADKGRALANDHTDDFRARMALYNDMVAADQASELEKILIQEAEQVEELNEMPEASQADKKRASANDHTDDCRARMALYKDMVAANQALELEKRLIQEAEAADEDENLEEAQEELDQEESDDQDIDNIEDRSDGDGEYESNHVPRSHPVTAAGKSGTKPSTIQIPKGTITDPITTLLADASKSQLREIAQKIFGGPLLPNSTATPSSKRTHLKQQPIALEASQAHMGVMEANAYIAAIIPGAYAAVMSTLEEVRTRLGPEWLQNLLRKPDGPLILDAGGGGAGALAWREVLRAEWKRLYPINTTEESAAPVGKATIVTGSSTLRHRASQLLENTTFLPRLPDYNPSLDHPAREHPKATPRKRYDIIIAPHTLWGLREDHMRKSQVQNFWSLLNPNGGVLILIEKGVPRGFELIAGAREMLLKHHIASPKSETAETNIQEPFEEPSREKEKGMIIAPCTNHFKCPLYLTYGANKGRKDFCHFSQRFNRPAFLQNIIGHSSRNHEDIDFSYIAVQRGIDQRQELGIAQGQAATNAAFAGYESAFQSQSEPIAIDAEPLSLSEASNQTNENKIADHSQPEQPAAPAVLVPAPAPFTHPLSLPRLILPPLKRDKHVILDLCTPSGTLERWTVPRSFSKQAYRDARKSHWGDLWGLGAKVRVPRNVRLGEKITRRKPRGERDEMDMEEEGFPGGGKGEGRDEGVFGDYGELGLGGAGGRRVNEKRRARRGRGKGREREREKGAEFEKRKASKDKTPRGGIRKPNSQPNPEMEIA